MGNEGRKNGKKSLQTSKVKQTPTNIYCLFCLERFTSWSNQAPTSNKKKRRRRRNDNCDSSGGGGGGYFLVGIDSIWRPTNTGDRHIVPSIVALIDIEDILYPNKWGRGGWNDHFSCCCCWSLTSSSGRILYPWYFLLQKDIYPPIPYPDLIILSFNNP